MPWGRIDDDAWRHHNFDNVGPHGYALFWAAVSYSNDKLLNGLLSHEHVERLLGYRRIPPSAIEELTATGCWEERPGGFFIHNYFEYNESADQIARRRADARARQERHRDKSVSNGVTNAVSNPVSDGARHTVTNAHVPVPGTRYPVTDSLSSRSLSAVTQAGDQEGTRERDGEEGRTTENTPSAELVAAIRAEYCGARQPTKRELRDFERAAIELETAGIQPSGVKRLRAAIHDSFPKYPTVPVYVLARYAHLLPPPITGVAVIARVDEPHGPPASPEAVAGILGELRDRLGARAEAPAGERGEWNRQRFLRQAGSWGKHGAEPPKGEA